jgi:hypothetical protein
MDFGLQQIHVPVVDKDISPILDALDEMIVQCVDRMSTFVQPVVHSYQ